MERNRRIRKYESVEKRKKESRCKDGNERSSSLSRKTREIVIIRRNIQCIISRILGEEDRDLAYFFDDGHMFEKKL